MNFSVLKPAVPRHWLFILAGLFWTFAGSVLCVRAFFWLPLFSTGMAVILETSGIAVAIIFYVLMFSSVVRKNIARICALPDRPCAFAFTPWRGYMMIALMITLGITLRNSSLPREYLVPPYTAMGGALLIGSYRFYRHFHNITKRRQPCLPSQDPSA